MTVRSDQSWLLWWGLRSGSVPEGPGTPRSLSWRAMWAKLWLARRWATIQARVGRGGGVGCELVESDSASGQGGVGVSSGVDEPVAVGRSSTEVAALIDGLSAPGVGDAVPGTRDLGVGSGSEYGHQGLVQGSVELDRPACLGQPQLHSVVVQERPQGVELAEVEGPFVFADHDPVDPTVGIGNRSKQCRGLRSLVPGHLAGAGSVEVLAHDHTAPFDHLVVEVELPGFGGAGVLVFGGGCPAVEQDPQQAIVGWTRVVTGDLRWSTGGEPLGERCRS